MAKITAAQVKELRDATGIGMMDGKRALEEAEGDFDRAVEILREKGLSNAAKKQDRIAAEGLSEVFVDGNRAAVVEVNSETDYVAKNADFQNLVTQIAEAVAKAGPTTLEEAKEASVEGTDMTIDELITEKTNTIGEKLELRRFFFIEKTDDQVFGPYVHTGGQIATLVVLNGGNEETAHDIALHVSALNPRFLSRDEVPQDVIEKEKSIQIETAKNEGKPENIVEKMVEGRMHKWLGEISLVDQSFVKDSDISVGEFAKQNDATVGSFVRIAVGEGVEKRQENLADEVSKELNK